MFVLGGEANPKPTAHCDHTNATNYEEMAGDKILHGINLNWCSIDIQEIELPSPRSVTRIVRDLYITIVNIRAYLLPRGPSALPN